MTSLQRTLKTIVFLLYFGCCKQQFSSFDACVIELSVYGWLQLVRSLGIGLECHHVWPLLPPVESAEPAHFAGLRAHCWRRHVAAALPPTRQGTQRGQDGQGGQGG